MPESQYNNLVLVIVNSNEVWLSLVERCVRDAEAVGSSPVTSTNAVGSELFLFGPDFCQFGY